VNDLCQETRRELSAALDGTDESLRSLQHLKLCEGCAAFARSLALLDTGLQESLGEVQAAPKGFAQRLLSTLPEESPSQLLASAEQRSRTETLGWLAVAAVLILGLDTSESLRFGRELGAILWSGGSESLILLTQIPLVWQSPISGGWLASVVPASSNLILALVIAVLLQAAALRGLHSEVSR
jgi:hypothetical protein